MATTSTGGSVRPTKTSEPSMRRANLEHGFPIYVDPNRPEEFRRQPFQVPRTQGSNRLRWLTPKAIPHRFLMGKIPGDGSPNNPTLADELAVQAFLHESVIKRATPEEYASIEDTVYSRLRVGVRIDSVTGCWLPADGQLSSSVYRETFLVTYGLRLDGSGRKPLHNLDDRSDDQPVDPKGLSDDNPYRNYITTKREPATIRVDLSHRCHDPFCMYPEHIILELHALNDARKSCTGPEADSGICKCMRTFAGMFAEENRPSDEWLTGHSCLVDPRSEPTCSLRREAEKGSKTWVVTGLPQQFLARLLPGPYSSSSRLTGEEDFGWNEEEVKSKIETAISLFQRLGRVYRDMPYVFLDMRIVDEFMFKQDPDGSSTSQSGIADRPRKYYLAYREKVARRIASTFNALETLGNRDLFEENMEDPVAAEVAQTADDVIVSPPPKGGVQKLLKSPKRQKR